MTTTEEVIRLAREMTDTVCNEIGPVAMCKDPLSFAHEVGVRLINLVRAEENEACAKVCEECRDLREEARSTLRAAEELKNGDEESILQALRHEGNVRLYHSAIDKCAASIRARRK